MELSIDNIKTMAEKYKNAFIYVKDECNRYVECNNNTLLFLGFTHIEELLGKSDYDLFEPYFARQYVKHDHVTALSGSLHVIESVLMPHGDIKLMSSQKYSFLHTETQQLRVLGLSIILKDQLVESFASMLTYNDFNVFKTSDSLFSVKINQNASRPLTEKELEVLYHMLQGLTQKQIADILDLSSRTVEDYINRIKMKLKCKTKDQLFEFAFHHGVLTLLPKSD